MPFRISPSLRVTLALSSICCGATAAAAQRPDSLGDADRRIAIRLDSAVRSRVAADSFSGVVLIARGDLPIYQLATGMANEKRGLPVRPDTRFNLGSIDKYFTRIAIRQLEQAGRLRMSDRVGQHLPDYPNARVRDEVTIAHLYHMRAGLPEVVSPRYHEQRRSLRTVDDYLRLFATDSLGFPPGTKEEYCNACFVVLGKIVERVSGTSWPEYARQRIFAPAGMTRTGYPDLLTGADDLAIGYTSRRPWWIPGYQADTTVRRPNADLLPARGAPDGGGVSTAGDLLKLSTALLGGKLLDRARLDSLLGPAFRSPKDGALLRSGWTGGYPGVSTFFYTFSSGHTVVVLSNLDSPAADVVGLRAQRLIQLHDPSTRASLLPPLAAGSPKAVRAGEIASLAAAGDSAGTEAALRKHGAPEYAATERPARGATILTAIVKRGGPYRVQRFELDGEWTIVWLRNASGRWRAMLLRENPAGQVTGVARDSREEPDSELQ